MMSRSVAQCRAILSCKPFREISNSLTPTDPPAVPRRGFWWRRPGLEATVRFEGKAPPRARQRACGRPRPLGVATRGGEPRDADSGRASSGKGEGRRRVKVLPTPTSAGPFPGGQPTGTPGTPVFPGEFRRGAVRPTKRPFFFPGRCGEASGRRPPGAFSLSARSRLEVCAAVPAFLPAPGRPPPRVHAPPHGSPARSPAPLRSHARRQAAPDERAWTPSLGDGWRTGRRSSALNGQGAPDPTPGCPGPLPQPRRD